ncbi:MAG: NADH-quinone oxidoreductase subunit A [Motiliproteus sp.]
MSKLDLYLNQSGPLAGYFFIVLSLVLLILVISHLLGERHQEPATGEPFESGVVHIGDTQMRFSAPYFLIAILFVIFDLEAAFIYIWAVTLHETGWPGYLEILIFITILAVALFYLWKIGALDWGPRGKAPSRQPPLQGHSEVLQGNSPPINPPLP